MFLGRFIGVFLLSLGLLSTGVSADLYVDSPDEIAKANEAAKEKQVVALKTIIYELQNNYGMSKFKRDNFGITFEGVLEKYEDLIDEATTVLEDAGIVEPIDRDVLSDEEFKQMLVAVAAEFKDGHYNIVRGDVNEAWTLGIYASDIDGRLFVTGFNPNLFTKGASNPDPRVGDEIIAVNDIPVSQIAKENYPYISLATHESRMQNAHHFILNRSKSWLGDVETNSEVSVTYKRGGGAKAKTFSGLYHWISTKDYRDAYKAIPNLRMPASLREKFVYGFSDIPSYFSEGINNLIKNSDSFTDLSSILNDEIDEAWDTARKLKTKAIKNSDLSDKQKERKHLAKLDTIELFPPHILLSIKAKASGSSESLTMAIGWME